MFAFFSKLRLPSSAAPPEEEGDDTSSLGRSLNLPWPVTESSARRPITPKREWASNSIQLSQTSGNSGVSISYPIPRTTPNSFTGFDDFPMPPSGLPKNLPSRTPVTVQAQAPYAPPEVVRLLDSGVNDGYEVENEHGGINPPPPRYQYEYTVHPSASSYALPYPYPSANIEPRIQQPASVKAPSHELEDNNGAELYSSPFEDPIDAIPTPPRSTGSSSSATAKTGGSGIMTKGRWNLKLQLHSTASKSTTSLDRTTPALQPNHSPVDDDPFPRPSVVPAKRPTALDASPVNVDTDVYNHAYNYPLAKQLSPIAEQSPGPDSESRSVSLKFGRGGDGSVGRPSPGAESLVGSVLNGGLIAPWKERDKEAVGDVADRESVKTRVGSVRTGSVGSIGTVNGNSTRSRAGSLSAGVVAPGGTQNASTGGSLASEIARPSPIHASPFITRHLNRTVSQTSSKSDSQVQGQTSQLQGSMPTTPLTIGSGSRPNTGSSSAPLTGREVPQTPISPVTAATTPTGTMYTPTSTLQTPVAQTPITPGGGGGGLVIQPPPAVLIPNVLPSHGNPSALPKIPSLPIMSPIDLRFSVIGSVAPRVSREVQMNRRSRAASHPGLGKVERMPVIEGSVEGFYEEEVEIDESDDDGYEEDEEEDEEYERESLHAESFVTAGTNEDAPNDNHNAALKGYDPEMGVELATLEHQGVMNSSPARSVSPRVPSAPASNSGSIRSLPSATLGPDRIPLTPGSVTGESFIHRRWERDAALGFGRLSSSPTTFHARGQSSRWPFRLFARSSSSPSNFTPAFWAFWLGFILPVLWLVGGWHFTNAGELPPKYTMWEWYFWNSQWSMEGLRSLVGRLLGCCRSRKIRLPNPRKEGVQASQDPTVESHNVQRRKGKRRSHPNSKVRIGKVYPSLPRWVAEKQSTDDGRMRLNDPKRSLRGISFGYPFIPRPPGSQDSSGTHNQSLSVPPSSSGTRSFLAVLGKPNRLLDLMYGVKLTEVRGRPESGRRMFDPWIQRCRYAFCYGLAVLAIGLCTASIYLIVVNTKKLE